MEFMEQFEMSDGEGTVAPDKQCSMNVMCFSISLSGTVTYPSNKRKFQGEMFTMQGFRPWLLFLSFSGHLRIFKLASSELGFWM